MGDRFQYIASFALNARPIIREYFRVDSCIASTAIAIKVLRHYDIEATPFPCRAVIYNAQFVQKALLLGRWPTEDELEEFTQDGSWSVGLGYAKTGALVVGHLAALAQVDGEIYLLDASFDQADRPAKNLKLPGVFCTKVPDDFANNGQQVAFTSREGDHVIYRSHPENTIWKTTANWTDDTLHREAVSRICKVIDHLSR